MSLLLYHQRIFTLSPPNLCSPRTENRFVNDDAPPESSGGAFLFAYGRPTMRRWAAALLKRLAKTRSRRACYCLAMLWTNPMIFIGRRVTSPVPCRGGGPGSPSSPRGRPCRSRRRRWGGPRPGIAGAGRCRVRWPDRWRGGCRGRRRS